MARRSMFLAAACLSVTAASPAPADDAEAVVRTLVAQDRALTDVGERLSIAARPLCSERGWASGIVLQTRSQYGRAYREAAAHVFGLGDLPTISVVIEGAAGERAGLHVGDQIVAIDGMPTRRDGGESTGVVEVGRALDTLDRGLADGVAEMTVRRGARTVVVALHATPACRARFEVRAGSANNASATAVTVQVSSDLVDPSRVGEDLAPLVAHELAHVVLRHEAVLDRRRGGILPGFGKNGATLRASEIEADRLSVWLLALAGYPPEAAVAFWTRFGRSNDYGILSDRTHPDWRSRVAAIREEVAQVSEQRGRGGAISVSAARRVTSLR